MKKTLFFLMVMAAVLTGCSNENTNELVRGNAIEFDGFVNKSTRGTVDLDNQTLNNFTVYGFMESAGGVIFDNEPVVKAESGAWTYTHKQYWNPGNAYYFSAIAPTVDAQWTYDTNDTTDGGIITYTNGEGNQDLIYAYTKTRYNMASASPKVGFNFYHLLSRVAFSFTNGFENPNITLNVTGVTIKNAVNKASIDMADPTNGWTALDDEVALDFGDTKFQRIEIGATSSTDHKYMIPLAKDYELEFTVEMYQGTELAGTFVHTVSIPHLNMLSNTSYKVQAELSATNINPAAELEEIQFEVSDLKQWD